MENNRKDFEGLKLTEQQRNQIEKFIKRIDRGRGVPLEQFFINIFKNDADYKVFIGDRTLTLMNLFYRLKYDKKDEKLGKSIYTESSFLARIPEIAEQYTEFDVFPKMLIVEDFCIYGYDINELIDNLLAGIIKYMRKKVEKGEIAYVDEHAIRHSLVLSLSIKSIFQSNLPSLMDGSYYHRFESLCVDPIGSLHCVLKNYSSLLMNNEFLSTSTTLSLYEKDFDDSIHTFFAQAADKNGFMKYEHRVYPYCEIWTKPLKVNGNVFAIYTLKLSQNEIGKRFSITPFIFMSDFKIKIENFQLLSNFKDDCITGLSRTRAEALNLLLSYNLLLLLQDECNEKLVIPERLDIDRIKFNFHSQASLSGENFLDKMLLNKKPFLSFKEMDAFILNLTEGSIPLFRNVNASNTISQRNWNEVVENIIRDDGDDIVKNANLQQIGKALVQSKIKAKPLYTFFEQMQKSVSINSDVDISCVIGEFVRYMSLGFISTKIIGAEDNYSYTYRAEDLSKLLGARQCYDNLPILNYMEHDLSRDLDKTCKRINEFYNDDPNLVKKLTDFVSRLYSTGQRVSDFVDTKFLDDDMKVPENQNELSNEEKRNLAEAQALKSTVKTLKLMRKYEEKYLK